MSKVAHETKLVLPRNVNGSLSCFIIGSSYPHKRSVYIPQTTLKWCHWIFTASHLMSYNFPKRCPFLKIQREARRLKHKPNITFDYFMECLGNLANNRQTRMLANHTDVHCSNVNSSSTFETMQKRMLQSAKRNLAQLQFFSLTEYQKENQILFENTFGLKFRKPGLVQLNSSAHGLKYGMKKTSIRAIEKAQFIGHRTL